MCLRPKGRCLFRGDFRAVDFGTNDPEGFVPVPLPHELLEQCRTTDGMHAVYRRFARVLPLRFAAGNVSHAARVALAKWRSGSNKKAKRVVLPNGKVLERR